MNAHALRGGELHSDAVVGKHYFIITGLGFLGRMGEARAIAVFWAVGGAGIEPEATRLGLYEYIAEVGMARAAQMGVAEAHDGVVLVAVAGAIIVGALLIAAVNVVGDCVGVGTKLHCAERGAGSGKGVPHAGRADKRVHPVGEALPHALAISRGEGNNGKCGNQGALQQIHRWGVWEIGKNIMKSVGPCGVKDYEEPPILCRTKIPWPQLPVPRTTLRRSGG